MEESKTVKEVLEDVIKTLSNIKVPMSEIDAIGIPIARSINGIKACINAIDNQEESENQNSSEPDFIIEEPDK